MFTEQISPFELYNTLQLSLHLHPGVCSTPIFPQGDRTKFTSHLIVHWWHFNINNLDVHPIRSAGGVTLAISYSMAANWLRKHIFGHVLCKTCAVVSAERKRRRLIAAKIAIVCMLDSCRCFKNSNIKKELAQQISILYLGIHVALFQVPCWEIKIWSSTLFLKLEVQGTHIHFEKSPRKNI